MARLIIHPGEHLQEELQELSLSAAQLAERLAVSEDVVEAILQGKCDLSANMALRLSHYFGTSAEFWMGLQNLYDLRLAEQNYGDAIKALPTLHYSVAA
jgi:addiction module HigA family antidote